ncbi:MAG: cytochrome bc complex cytochrome b subunit [Candidatus Tectomicrobia bacterium]|nr:cytochrome bc complex cytochrome b subunit [Candidatus Tectomicrobia bacterium]
MEEQIQPESKHARASWLRSRLPIVEAMAFLRHKQVPWHATSYIYFMGGLALLFFGVQVLTGVLLLLYYTPTPEAAHESVLLISAKVPYGWLLRSIHSWSANLMILAVFLHFFSVYFMRAYRPPRELTWVSGFLLMVLAMGFGFSGYLLPWTKLSYFATKIGTDLTKLVPVLGESLGRFLLGADEIGGPTLTRFFAFHVGILPPVFVVVLMLHLLLIQRFGMSEPLGSPASKNIPFLPNFVMRESIVWVIVLGLLGVISVYFPWEVGEKADPLAPAPAGIRPEWYFTYLSQTLKYIPPKVLGMEGEAFGVYTVGVFGLALFLVPFWDRWAARGRRHWLVTAFGVAAIVYMVTMIALAYLKPY